MVLVAAAQCFWVTDYAQAEAEAGSQRFWLDDMRDTVDVRTTTLAQKLDEFLSDRRYRSQQNTTQLSLTLGANTSEREISPIVKPRLRLRLPNLEQTVFFDILGYRGTDIENLSDQNLALAGDFLDGEDKQVLQLRWITESGRFRISPRVGLAWTDGNVNAFGGVEASLYGEPSEAFSYRVIQNILTSSQSRAEANTFLRGDWQISETSVLRGQVQVTWEHGVQGVDISSGLIFRHALNARNVLSFEGYTNTKTRSSHDIDSFLVGVRYRRLIYKDWVFAEIAPWVSQERATGFDPVYGARLEIELNF